MAETEAREVIMICTPTARLPRPHVPSHREACRECGAEVWVDSGAAHTACICTDCALERGRALRLAIHPDVRARLRGLGWTDDRIDRIHGYARAIMHGPRGEG